MASFFTDCTYEAFKAVASGFKKATVAYAPSSSDPTLVFQAGLPDIGFVCRVFGTQPTVAQFTADFPNAIQVVDMG